MRSTSHLRLRRSLCSFAIATAALAGCSDGADTGDASGATESGATSDIGTIVPATEQEPSTTAAVSESNPATADDDLYDEATVHSISVTFDQDDYDEMIDAYQSNGDKEWITADVTIDGVEYTEVGLRLKGNSSLFGISGGGAGGPTGPGIGDAPVIGDGEVPAFIECADGVELPQPPDGNQPAGGGAGLGGGVGMTGDANADRPESLPWLIRLDKYVDDQQHQGYTELVVRSNSSETAINEATALDLLGEAGLATQEAAVVRFSVNGSAESLRLVIENPDDSWAERALGDGALYKADAQGDYSFRGTDPEAYTEAWEQDAGKDITAGEDYSVLIDFLDFINNSTDADFAAQLPEHLDVESFARYLAIEDLMGNFDDIAGPGNNSYLYFDPDTGVATVVAWDHNLALSGMGAGFGGGPGAAAVSGTPAGGGPGGFPALPEGCEFTGDFSPPVGPSPVPGDGTTPSPGGGAAGDPFSRGNVLVERFTAVPEFAALYDTAMDELTTQLIDSGLAARTIDQWESLISGDAGDLVTAETVATEADRVRSALGIG